MYSYSFTFLLSAILFLILYTCQPKVSYASQDSATSSVTLKVKDPSYFQLINGMDFGDNVLAGGKKILSEVPARFSIKTGLNNAKVKFSNTSIAILTSIQEPRQLVPVRLFFNKPDPNNVPNQTPNEAELPRGTESFSVWGYIEKIPLRAGTYTGEFSLIINFE